MADEETMTPSTPATLPSGGGIDVHAMLQRIESLLSWTKDHLIQQRQPGGDPSDPATLAAEKARVVADYAKSGASPNQVSAPDAGGMSAEVLARAASRTPTQYQQGNPGGAPSTDPVADLLRQAPTSDDVRHQAWDAFETSANADELATKLTPMPLPKDVKHDLWNLKEAQRKAPTDINVTIGAPDESSMLSGAKDLAASAAPTVGGVVGGLVGGIPGAAIGGAAGEGYQQLIRHAGEIGPAALDVARNIVSEPVATARGATAGMLQGLKDSGLEAATMAAGEGVGKLVVGAATGTARWMMNQAGSTPMALAREFPELSQTLIDHALTYTKGGLNQARSMLTAYKRTAFSALDQAAANGAKVPLTEATSALGHVFDDAAVNSADPVGALAKLAAIERKIGQGRAAQLTMREADALKTSLQREVKALYKQVQSGGGTKGMAIELLAKASMADALNQAIERIATQAGAVGYKAANASAQELIGAVRAISRRLLMHGTSVGHVVADVTTPSLVGGVTGGLPGAAIGAASATAAKIATLPSNLSRMAVSLTHPAVQAFLRQLPKPALVLLRQYLWPTSGSADSTGTPQ